jgi:hypothetical protein
MRGKSRHFPEKNIPVGNKNASFLLEKVTIRSENRGNNFSRLPFGQCYRVKE